MPSNDDCSYGVQNQKEIEKTNERFTLMIDHITSSIASLGGTMNDKFDELNTKINAIDEKLDSFKKELPEQIDSAVDNKMKASVFNLVKWIIISITGSGIAALVTRYILRHI
jgi:predicted PurR-regulated permease PerM